MTKEEGRFFYGGGDLASTGVSRRISKKNEEELITKIRRKATILAVVGVLVVSLTVAVVPVFACNSGCTPGFWTQPQHFGYWTDPYSPDMTVGEVFIGIEQYFPDLADDTLLEALDYGGGPNLEGAARIYLRAAVATLLSSAYNQTLATPEDPDPWGYAGWAPDEIAARVVPVLSWGDRATILSNASLFDGYNNME